MTNKALIQKEGYKLVAACEAHACDHYEEGYDVFVECYGDEEWSGFLEGITSLPKAKIAMASLVRRRNDRMSEACDY